MVKALSVLLLFCMAAPCAAEPLATYERRLLSLKQELEVATKAGRTKEAVRAAKESLGRVAKVSLPSGEEVVVDNSALAAELEAYLGGQGQGKGEGVESIARKMDSLSGAVSLYREAERGQAMGPSSGQAMGTVKEVLGRREFRQGVAEKGWSGLVRLLWRVLARISEAMGRTGRFVGWALLLLGAVGLAAMTVSLVLKIAGAGGISLRGRPEETLQRARDEGLTSSEEALLRAEDAAKRGDYREALRCLYRGLLLLLAEQGLVKYGEATTNWEYVGALRLSAAEYEPILVKSTTLFERRWYGLVPATAADYADLTRTLESLRSGRSGEGGAS